MKFLLVEDERAIAELIEELLGKEGYIIDKAADLEIAREALSMNEYPVVILDRMLPDGDGADLVSWAERKGIQSRFIILSALSQVGQRIDGLNKGADDYLVKPFEPEELLARIHAALRRPLPEREETLEFGNVTMTSIGRNITINGETVTFARRELAVFEVLMKSAGKVVARNIIEEQAYSYDDEVQSNTLESHMSRIRKNLKKLDAGVEIHAVRGLGYIMKEAK